MRIDDGSTPCQIQGTELKSGEGGRRGEVGGLMMAAELGQAATPDTGPDESAVSHRCSQEAKDDDDDNDDDDDDEGGVDEKTLLLLLLLLLLLMMLLLLLLI